MTLVKYTSVTLDPNTPNSGVILSKDLTCMRNGFNGEVPPNPRAVRGPLGPRLRGLQSGEPQLGGGSADGSWVVGGGGPPRPSAGTTPQERSGPSTAAPSANYSSSSSAVPVRTPSSSPSSGSGTSE